MHRTLWIAVVVAALQLSLPAGAAQTRTYSGTGTFSVARTLMPLAHGGAALHLATSTVAAVQPSESGFMDGDCAGLGYIDAEGTGSVDVICNYELNRNDAFIVRITGEPGQEAKVKVLGGSGSFDKATGTGTLQRTYLEGDRGSYKFEFKITTP